MESGSSCCALTAELGFCMLCRVSCCSCGLGFFLFSTNILSLTLFCTPENGHLALLDLGVSSCRAGEERQEARGETFEAIWEPAAARAEKLAADKPAGASRRSEDSFGTHSEVHNGGRFSTHGRPGVTAKKTVQPITNPQFQTPSMATASPQLPAAMRTQRERISPASSFPPYVCAR